MKHAPGFLAITNAAKAVVDEITVERLLARLSEGDAPAIVDVREDGEWRAGHLPGAVHLGKGVIERDVEGVFADRDCELVLYCGGGYRSALAAKALQDMGYTNVWSLAGGRRAWLAAGGAWTDEP